VVTSVTPYHLKHNHAHHSPIKHVCIRQIMYHHLYDHHITQITTNTCEIKSQKLRSKQPKTINQNEMNLKLESDWV